MSRWLGGRGWCAASGRSFALTRQGVRLLHRFVNCGPARRLRWPVLAPAEGIVRAGDVLRGDAAPAWEPRSSCAGRAVLSECPAFDYACLAVLSRCPVFDHACCLPHSAKQDGLRYLAFLFRRGRAAGLCVLKRLCGHPTWRVHFWFVRFLTAARGTRGTEPAARCKCAFSQSHWLCNVFRGEYAGAPRPRLRQRVFDSLDSLHLGRGVGALGAARAFENNKGLSFVPTSRSTRVHGETCPSPIYARASRAVQR